MSKNNSYISRKGYTIYKNTISINDKNKIENDLKITPYNNDYNLNKTSYLIYLENSA